MHGTQLHKYKLLAFVCSIKRYRKNSIIYGNEKKYGIYTAVGITASTYSKYLTDSVKLGLCRHLYGNYYFIGLKRVIEALFEDLKEWRYNTFFAQYNHTTFKDFFNEINISILRKNVSQQDYQRHRIEQNITRKSERITGYTGKTHLSNLLGCSPSTASRRLRTWGKVIKRTIIYIPWKLKTNDIKSIRNFHSDMVFIDKEIMQVKGSKVTFKLL